MEELGQWVVKNDKHTFWPSNWDYNKVKQMVTEASENIVFKRGNRFRGITKSSIAIEMIVNLETKEIATAFIYFEKL